MSAAPLPLLYHAPSSHYSMIARLALTEAGEPFQMQWVDIHRARENQAPWYVRLNPDMTVPTLVIGERVLPDSRLILDHAFPGTGSGPEEALIERFYRFPVDAYTFGWLMRWNPVARFLFPRKLARIRGDMLALAQGHPDLAEAYRRRAGIFDQRTAAFSQPPKRHWPALQAQVGELLDAMQLGLAGRPYLSGEAYGAADVVATVFLARLHFCRQGGLLAQRPVLAAYWARMRGRDSFVRADVWDRLRPQLLLSLIG